jgi:hypothetical protein
VLRSFRVLRVMKVFKYLDSLKMIAAVRAGLVMSWHGVACAWAAVFASAG